LLFKSKTAEPTEASVSRTGLTLDLDFGNNDGSATPVVYDSSGWGRHATSTAGATSPTCNQYFCDFTNDYMTADATDVLNNSSLSIAMKFSPDFAADDGIQKAFLDTANINFQYSIIKNDSNQITIRIGGVPLSLIELATYQPYWKVGEENIIIIRGDATNDDTYVWLNGNLILDNDQTLWTQSESTRMVIGANKNGDYAFDGRIHYLKIWNRLLTNDEVAILSADRETTANTAPRAGATGSSTGTLVGYWTMDANDINGDKIYEKSGTNASSTLILSPTITEGKINQALNFTVSNYIIATSSAYNLTSAVTLSSWIKVDAGTITGRSVIGKWDNNKGYMMWLDSVTGAVGCPIDAAPHLSSGVVPSVGVWMHTACVYDGINVYVYVDGVLKGQQAESLSNATGNFIIGAYADGVSGKFRGSIDDVRIYNYALSAQEIANLYSASKEVHMQAPSKKDMSLNLDFGNNNGSDPVTVFDSSGFKRHATSTTGATMPACTSYFCDFNGSQYMTANATNVFNSSNISIAFKFTPDFALDTATTYMFFDTHATGRVSIVHRTDGGFDWTIGGVDLGTVSAASIRPYWKTGQENVLLVIAVSTNSKMYLNGNLIKTSATAWTADNPSYLVAGAYNSKLYPFDGRIHYLKVWNRLLTDAEVQYLSADRQTFMR
ncbi:LamG domain-containing protein, partial [Patescibacteria group bacterium]|nr:LamG domain-containing protein [Patescibacteria group bacterium]